MTPHIAMVILRRQLVLGWWLRAALVLVVVIGMGVGNGALKAVLLIGVGAAWISMSWHSRRGSALAAAAPTLIASGQFVEAEESITASLRSFSLFRQSKLLSLHHLATLRHAQGRWSDSILLCRGLLAQRLGRLAPLARSAHLMSVEAYIELGDILSAYRSLAWLYAQRLPLVEAVKLLTVQIDYEAHVGAWQQMLAGLEAKSKLAELMPARECGKTYALLALAARKTGQAELENFLSRRAEFLTDVKELTDKRPMLRELWA